MYKKTIAVLFGGCSSEYAISLQSAYSVLTQIDRTDYHVIPVGISKKGSGLPITANMKILQTIPGRKIQNGKFPPCFPRTGESAD